MRYLCIYKASCYPGHNAVFTKSTERKDNIDNRRIRENMNTTKVMIIQEWQNVMQKAGVCGTGIGNNWIQCTSCQNLPSVLWCCWLGSRKVIWPVKNWVVGCWHGYLGWGADLHITQQMPLPLTNSCSSKSRLVLPFLVLPFWYLVTWVVPDKFQKSSKTVVCVCLQAVRSWYTANVLV